MNNYRFGATSMRRMTGVHPSLIVVAFRVLARMTVADLTVPRHGGIRTLEIQEELIEAGRSRTRNSAHLTGDALDLVPYIDGAPRWAFEDEDEWPVDFAGKIVPRGYVTRLAYEEKWRLWKVAARELGFTFRRRISWDWPHHQRAERASPRVIVA